MVKKGGKWMIRRGIVVFFSLLLLVSCKEKDEVIIEKNEVSIAKEDSNVAEDIKENTVEVTQNREIAISLIEGDVKVSMGDDIWEVPEKEAYMQINQSLRVGAQGQAEFLLEDGTHILLNENSTVTLINGDGDKNTHKLKLDSGALLVLSSIIDKEQKTDTLGLQIGNSNIQNPSGNIVIIEDGTKTSISSFANNEPIIIQMDDAEDVELNIGEQLIVDHSIDGEGLIELKNTDETLFPIPFQKKIEQTRPLNVAAINYENYLSLEPKMPIDIALNMLGTGTVTLEGNNKRWIWSNGDKIISAVAFDGMIIQLTQRNLSEDAKELLDFANVHVRDRLLHCDSWESIRAVLSTDGVELSQALMEDDSIVRMVEWKSPGEARYRATINETTGHVDHSF